MRTGLGAAISILGLTLLAGCTMSLGQSPVRVVEGVVIDQNDKPVKGVIITTDPPTSSVVTNELGCFLIKSLKEGVYTINAEKVGFVSDPVTINIQGFDSPTADIRILPEGMTAAKPVAPAGSSRKNASPSAAESSAAAVTESSVKEKDSANTATDETKKKKWWEK